MEALLRSRVGRRLTLRPAAGPWHGSALVLHGGREASTAPTSALQLAVLRIDALAGSLHTRVAGHGVAVWFLRFGVRGWNGTGSSVASPVADTAWALEEIRRQGDGRPVVLVGHSMGGRTAVHAAGDESVRGVVGLAPWLTGSDPVQQLRGRRLLIGHGTADRITDPRLSRQFLERAGAVTSAAEFVDVPGETHALLRQASTWNGLAARGVLEGLDLT